nr:MAG TPA: DNA-directed RNA polymerase [Bacteriophage sp.]
MAEYIEREALREILDGWRDAHADVDDVHGCSLLEDVICEVDAQTAANVAPVVYGRWISFLGGDHIMPERYYRCSRCGRVESRRQPYCHCGAKMDGERKDGGDS